jgi:acetate kinase
VGRLSHGKAEHGKAEHGKAGSAVRILTVNAGSTSVKVSLIDGPLSVAGYGSLDEALAADPRPEAIGHRVVHGGHRTGAVVIDDDVTAQLRNLIDLAPLQQPPALEALDRCRREFPEVPQVACFDTAFHTTMPPAATTYALPRRFREQVRVYGFHGLSHAWASSRVAALAPAARRVVVAHLGGGQSLCGVVDGRSAVTTMGFTPLDGLVMATRSGSVDPGAVLWLARHTDEDLSEVLERQSGLLGLCGSADMREVLRRAGQHDASAELALEVYLHRLIEKLGGCVAVIGGLDALVFTGGVGEHAARIRELAAQRLAWLGVDVDPDAADEEISAAGAGVRVFNIHAREDLQIAREVTQLLRPA